MLSRSAKVFFMSCDHGYFLIAGVKSVEHVIYWQGLDILMFICALSTFRDVLSTVGEEGGGISLRIFLSLIE